MSSLLLKKSLSDTTLAESMFYEILFPEISDSNKTGADDLLELRKRIQFGVSPLINIREQSLVVFDVETTGLNYNFDQIIEIGAVKMINFKPVAEFSSFASFNGKLENGIIKLTGITDEMLVGAPPISKVVADFLDFFSGSFLVAHNADFDMGMLKAACSRINIELDWPALCTLKMSRALLKDLPNRKLDTLAEYYGLQFESRHRSIGDVKVTCDVLKAMLDDNDDLVLWSQFEKYRSS